MTEHFDVALRGIEQSQQQLDGRRFARAVRAEQAEHLAWPDLEIHIIHRPGFGPAPEVFEHFRQPANDDDIFRRWWVAGCGLWSFQDGGHKSVSHAGFGASCGTGSVPRPGPLSAGRAEAAWNGSSSSPMRTSRALLNTTTSEPALCRTAAMMGFR